jgi:hypothetical protein
MTEHADAETDLLDRVVRATKELIRADGDASWLSAEEIKVLTGNGCAVWEDGRLLFTEDWAESFDRAWNGR